MNLSRILRVSWCLCLLSASSGAWAQDLGEWRALTEEEENARTEDVESDSIDPAMIEADFDGDKIEDGALIAIRKSDGARGLIVVMKDRVHVIDTEHIGPKDGLGLAPPGSWDTVCGNAFREFHREACNSGYPARIKLKTPGILLIGNGSTVLHFWNPRTKRFNQATIVD
ncbi:MAG TPA: hypothetical protein VEZ16_06130 [Microvirga sp.]|nr:hypothetical protein [Microvirga sp.]